MVRVKGESREGRWKDGVLVGGEEGQRIWIMNCVRNEVGETQGSRM